MKSALILSILVFLLSSLLAQTDTPDVLSKLDSALVNGELNWEEYRKLKLEMFYSELNRLNPDSTFSIDMRNLGADSMPDFSRFYKLKELNLSGNKFTRLTKKSLPDVPLEALDLSNNPWEKIKFKRNDSLKTLWLNETGLSKPPRSLKKLKGLERLQLEHNELTKIPRSVKKMKSLKEITLNFNHIVLTKKDIGILKNIERLQIISNDLQQLPENFGELKNLKKLNLAQNHLSTLPKSFSALKKLESVIFYKNKFENIPTGIFALRNLEELDFYYNKIEMIPPEIKELKNLKLLYLAFNSISEIPESINELKHLKKLYLHHNQIIAVPEWLAENATLEVLDLGYNKIVVIPDFSKAVSLTEVDVQANYLSILPWSLLELPKLKIIYIKDNPFLLEESAAVRLRDLIEERRGDGLTVVY